MPVGGGWHGQARVSPVRWGRGCAADGGCEELEVIGKKKGWGRREEIRWREGD